MINAVTFQYMRFTPIPNYIETPVNVSVSTDQVHREETTIQDLPLPVEVEPLPFDSDRIADLDAIMESDVGTLSDIPTGTYVDLRA